MKEDIKVKDLSWEFLTRKVELPPYEEWEQLPIPKTKLYDLIYDRLANNTDAEMFEPEMATEMAMVYNADTHEGSYISITIGDKQYQLTLREVKDDLYVIND